MGEEIRFEILGHHYYHDKISLFSVLQHSKSETAVCSTGTMCACLFYEEKN